MKRINSILAIILLVVMSGCGRGKQSTDDLITVHVSTSYPEKELILQDFMDVEYITLETTDEFLTQGLVSDIGNDYMLVRNRVNDGDLFIFDRKTGKGVRKINRKGQGAEEYVRLSGVVRSLLDEVNGEIFIKATPERMNVYDLYGNFKRSFRSSHYDVFEYDKDNLIGYDMSDFQKKGEDRDREKAYHVLISKLDGSITREIFIPFETINTLFFVIPGVGRASSPEFSQIKPHPHQGKWIFADASSDTLYVYSPDHTLTPFLVRTPSTHAMDPEIFLSITTLSDSYIFMQTVVNDFNFETGRGFHPNFPVYDKQENATFKYTVYNGDYTEKRPLFSAIWNPYNHAIAASVILEAHQLVEDYRKGILKGRLKEIAAKLDVEDNPVIMLVKHKK